ncbi:EF-hand domain-containing protein [Pararhizobium sp. IMCC21322]|uniref:EF-hand domain-containing protein n=1 Tax=Pararhizobium sp. IMCC21322 TaxID=3067903 RepID=UPI002742141B|nr:calcium-binding protein [Pararhizobium sp. IMCC21322]
MKYLPIYAATVVALLTSTSFATAQADHGHGTNPPGETSSGAADPGMMGGDHSQMMQMMKGMHAQMMAGKDMAGKDMGGKDMGGKDMGGMGTGAPSGMATMDSDMMRMMVGSTMMGAPGSEDASVAMQSRLVEFDADGDGSLSLPEFQALHTAMIREAMVDRFQHLDADGDGKISTDEMGAPMRRMEMRGMTGGAGSMMDNVSEGNTLN